MILEWKQQKIMQNNVCLKLHGQICCKAYLFMISSRTDFCEIVGSQPEMSSNKNSYFKKWNGKEY